MVEWQSLDSFKSIADVNLWGMILVTQTFLPLVKRARGRVINMGSILGKKYFSAFSGYQGVGAPKMAQSWYVCRTVDPGSVDRRRHERRIRSHHAWVPELVQDSSKLLCCLLRQETLLHIASLYSGL